MRVRAVLACGLLMSHEMKIALRSWVFVPLLAWVGMAACGDDSPGVSETEVREVELEVEVEPEVFEVEVETDDVEVVDVETAEIEVVDETTDVPETVDTPDTVEVQAEVETVACDLEPGDAAFDDHTVTDLPTSDCFFQFAGAFEREPVAVKFVMINLRANVPAADVKVRFYDNGFYQLHDEWFWFRLLNGQAIPDLAQPAPVQGFSFPTIAAVYQAFAGQADMPLDLQRLANSGRIYSPGFYSLAALSQPLAARFFGLGTVVHYEAHPDRVFPEEVWGFELEFSDVIDVQTLERIWAALEVKLPPEASAKLRWITRSPQQDAVARALVQGGHPRGGRTLTYDDLVIDGAVEVYNEGIAAGYVKVLDADFGAADLKADELAVLPRVPDDIPPSRAIVSAVPQTALAHVNLLAKSRGTPNAYIAGIASWAQLGDWEYQHTPVVFAASVANGVQWKAIALEDYRAYLLKIAPPVRHVQAVEDLANAPLTVSLTEGGLAQMKELVPLAGGKSAGFLSFLEVPAMNTPDAPMGITIKAFVEHQAEFLPWLEEALASQAFADSRVRYLVLEGEDAFLAEYGDDPVALALLESVHQAHAEDGLGQILLRGGARQMLVDKPMKYEMLRDIRAALVARYGFLARTQGLRFRSSSTAEDVPGFNGAGLYVSNTGFLYPSELADPSDRSKTVEAAIKLTWSSYWGFQAFEERRAGGIDHFEGNMAVAVHARFDDDKERANAVATFWINDYVDPPTRRLVMNVQKGALAVTNPGGTSELPEVDVVEQVGDAAPTIARVQRSTVAEPDEWLFSEAELLTMFAQADEHAGKWLVQQGVGVPLSERPKTLVLDYELKYVKAGWPALASGEVRPERIIWRQARVLDQVARVTPTAPDPWNLGSLPLATYMPQDLRTAARTVVADRCNNEWVDLRVYRVFTESSQSELFPFTTSPFIYKVVVDFKQAPPGLTPSMSNWLIQWTNFLERRYDATGTRIVLNSAIAQTLGIDGFELSPVPGGTFKVWKGDVAFESACTVRETKLPYQSGPEFLRALLASP